jgi:hypothetical protein
VSADSGSGTSSRHSGATDSEVNRETSITPLNTQRVSTKYGHWFFRQRRSKEAGETLCRFLKLDFDCFEYPQPEFCAPG